MIPTWLTGLSVLSLAAGVASAVIIALDERHYRQHMAIMILVWPICALFGSVILLRFYYAHGRGMPAGQGMRGGSHDSGKKRAGFAVAVAKGALHCGAGCTLGDLVAETLLALFPVIAVWLGFGTLFGQRIFAAWSADFIAAFSFGIVFQYFAIVPMRHLRPGEGLKAALKADTLSLTAWQVGMYGFMAIAHFWIFGTLLGVELKPASLEFWFMMQIAMLAGFATAYPVNWWLIRAGIKEAM